MHGVAKVRLVVVLKLVVVGAPFTYKTTPEVVFQTIAPLASAVNVPVLFVTLYRAIFIVVPIGKLTAVADVYWPGEVVAVTNLEEAV